jgi:hypothetical protein
MMFTLILKKKKMFTSIEVHLHVVVANTLAKGLLLYSCYLYKT